MATTSRENKRVITALKRDGWREHRAGQYYSSPNGSLVLVRVKYLLLNSVTPFETPPPKTPFAHFAVYKHADFVGASDDLTSLVATLRLIGEI